jgi:ribonuclease G
LVIDQTESMCTVDVNTGAFVGHKNFDDTVLRTNLQAASAIARQLRLRNLGGIILVDFIDMARVEHRAQVQAELERHLARDAVRTVIHGFTALGLMELTRKRVRESLSHQLCEPCPMCDTTGHIKTAQTVCYEILREIELEARQFNPQGFSVIASGVVVDRLMAEEALALAALEKSIGKNVALQVDFNFPQEAFEVILS